MALELEVVAPGIIRVAVPSDTLPPATSTNAWLIGDQQIFVVDPGGNSEAVRGALYDAIGGRSVLAIVLTHHHRDHIAGVQHLAQATGADVWAHSDTCPVVPFEVARRLREGEVLRSDLGEWTVLHTPGHAVGHICLLRDDGHVITGDLLAGEGTILIGPPEGHLATYLHSLRRVAATGAHTALPAHGAALDAQALLSTYVQHRGHRTDQVLEALTDGPTTPMALAERIYAQLPAAFHPIAAHQLRAHLTWLGERGHTMLRPDGSYTLHAHVD